MQEFSHPIICYLQRCVPKQTKLQQKTIYRLISLSYLTSWIYLKENITCNKVIRFYTTLQPWHPKLPWGACPKLPQDVCPHFLDIPERNPTPMQSAPFFHLHLFHRQVKSNDLRFQMKWDKNKWPVLMFLYASFRDRPRVILLQPLDSTSARIFLKTVFLHISIFNLFIHFNLLDTLSDTQEQI